MAVIQAYPLQWPVGWKRTPGNNRDFGRFGSKRPAGQWGRNDISVAEGINRILGELGRMGISRNDLVISTNLTLRLDGLPRSDQKHPEDPGVAVYWMDGKEQRCMAIDRYTKVEQNLGAVAATLDAMRAIERHGGAEIMNRAYTGFNALPESTQTIPAWRAVLGFKEGTEVTAKDVELNYRALSKKQHPDMPGGDAGQFAMLTRAKDMALAEVGNV